MIVARAIVEIALLVLAITVIEQSLLGRFDRIAQALSRG